MAKDKSARPKSVIDLKLLNDVAKAGPKAFRPALAIRTKGLDSRMKQRKARLRQLMAPEQPV